MIPFLVKADVLTFSYTVLTVTSLCFAPWVPCGGSLLSWWHVWDMGKDTVDSNKTSRKEEDIY